MGKRVKYCRVCRRLAGRDPAARPQWRVQQFAVLAETGGFGNTALIRLMHGAHPGAVPGESGKSAMGSNCIRNFQAVISHEHSAIFVHIPKTAGQSVETVFLKKLGLSWKQRAPLLLRRNDDGSRGPQRLAHLYAWEYVKYGYCTRQVFEACSTFSIVRTLSAGQFPNSITGGRMRMVSDPSGTTTVRFPKTKAATGGAISALSTDISGTKADRRSSWTEFSDSNA